MSLVCKHEFAPLPPMVRCIHCGKESDGRYGGDTLTAFDAKQEPLTAEQWWDKNVLHHGRRMTPFKMTGKNIWKYMDEFAAYVLREAVTSRRATVEKLATHANGCQYPASACICPLTELIRPAALAGETRQQGIRNMAQADVDNGFYDKVIPVEDEGAGETRTEAEREQYCTDDLRQANNFLADYLKEWMLPEFSGKERFRLIHFATAYAAAAASRIAQLLLRAEAAEAALTQAQQELKEYRDADRMRKSR